jgi:hypothetical protein
VRTPEQTLRHSQEVSARFYQQPIKVRLQEAKCKCGFPAAFAIYDRQSQLTGIFCEGCAQGRMERLTASL